LNVVEVNYEEESLSDHPPPKAVEQYCSTVLSFLSVETVELSVLFCTDAYIRKLNRVYRNNDTATDVLSFPQTGPHEADAALPAGRPGRHAGDIVISMETCAKNIEKYNVSKDEEVKRLLIHGILHLMGMDHSYENLENQEMIKKQEHILHSVNGVELF
jgi:probable rRNA maturation factor